jgi:cytochrome b6-f complex iron-sulfur subunit
MDEEQKEPQAPAGSRPARPVDPEREAKIAAAKAMAAKVAAARAASANPPAAAPAAGGRERPPDPEREAKIAAAKAMAAKVAAARAGGGSAGGAAAGAGPAGGAAAARPAATATVSRPAAPAVSSQAARAAAAEAARAAFRNEDPDVVTRRYVLRWLLWGSVAAWFGLAGGTAVAMFWPNKITGFGGVIPAGTTDQFPPNVRPPVTVTEAHAYVVNPGEGILALWWKCVHLGCTVPWVPSEDHFHCPCHGSVYLYNGQRIAGPAPRSLDLFPVMITTDNKVFINTNPSVVYQRLTYKPSQATPLTRNNGQWSWTKGRSL